ncbi:hypothetical protein KKG66_11535, partial [bacterium]|nr:hypothetical protein [bacterium]
MDLPQDKVMDTMAGMLNNGQGGTVEDATLLLWNQHDPWMVWVILGAVGAFSIVMMLFYYYKTRKNGQSAISSAT